MDGITQSTIPRLEDLYYANFKTKENKMKKICIKGHKISNEDIKVLDHYILITPREWGQGALNGMVYKSIKIICREWIEKYKSKSESISSKIEDILIGILGMEEFKPYNTPSPENEVPERDSPRINEVWENGFEIKDYEDSALRAFYKDPEQTLYDFMENKIAKRKNAFIKDGTSILIAENSDNIIYSRKDKFIQEFTTRPEYKNRKQRESV